MKYFAIIPARGGSKRLPGKNVKPIMGMPLIYWSIKTCQDSKLLGDFAVSTDDSEIKACALKYGAKVIDRPPDLAIDSASVIPTLIHALKPTDADAMVMIQPTSPIRTEQILDQCLSKFESEKPDSLSTGFNSVHFEWGSMPSMASQLMRPFFYNDGCVEIHKREVTMAGLTYGANRYKFYVPQYFSHEIDNEIDFIEVEAVMKHLKEKNPNDPLFN